MHEQASMLHFLLGTAAAGLIATTLMTVFVESFSKMGAVQVDMLRAIGSLFTPDPESFARVGAIVHSVSGIGFAFVYTFVLALLGVSGIGALTGIGLMIGAAHGFVLSFMLIISVAEHHPIEKYRDVGAGIAAIYLVAHLIFGAAVGCFAGLFGVIA